MNAELTSYLIMLPLYLGGGLLTAEVMTKKLYTKRDFWLFFFFWPLLVAALPWWVVSFFFLQKSVLHEKQEDPPEVTFEPAKIVEIFQWENYSRLLRQAKDVKEVSRLELLMKETPEVFTLEEKEKPALVKTLLERERRSLLTPEEREREEAEEEAHKKERAAKRAARSIRAKQLQAEKLAEEKAQRERLANKRVRTPYGRTAHEVKEWPARSNGVTVCGENFRIAGRYDLSEVVEVGKLPPCKRCLKEGERQAKLKEVYGK